jgi:nucleoside permease NupC
MGVTVSVKPFFQIVDIGIVAKAHVLVGHLLDDGDLAPQTRLIMSSALCGFAILSSLGIMIGGLATIV